MQICKYDFPSCRVRTALVPPNAISIPLLVLPPKDSCALQIPRIGEVAVEKMFDFGRSSGNVLRLTDNAPQGDSGVLFFSGLRGRLASFSRVQHLSQDLTGSYRQRNPSRLLRLALSGSMPSIAKQLSRLSARQNSTLWGTTFVTSHHRLHQHAENC